MKSQIRIVKRKPDPARIDREAEFDPTPVEQSAREITIVVKKWIAEMKERKSSDNSKSSVLR